jgi:hypothetical protein
MKLMVTLMVLALAMNAFAHLLGDLSTSMKPGEWKELSTTGFNQSLLWAGSDGIFNYSDDISWDPASEKLLYVGGGHATTNKFITYNSKTNAWRHEPDPPFISLVGHGYDHNGIDQNRGWFYHHPMSGRLIVYRYEIQNNTWRVGASIPDFICTWESMSCCKGFGFYPDYDRGGIVIANGKVNRIYWFGTTSGKWKILGSKSMNGIHSIAKYNPVHKIMVFGGGNDNNRLYKLDSTGTLSDFPPAPISEIGIQRTAVTCDPVTGEVLVLTDNGSFYALDPGTNEWKKQSSAGVAVFQHGGANINFTVCGAINTYGVTVWCKYASSTGKVFLHKRAEMSNLIKDYGVDKNISSALLASPNPFHQVTTLRLNHKVDKKHSLKIKIFNLKGVLVDILTPELRVLHSGITWNAAGLPSGIYVVRWTMEHKIYKKQLILMK